MRTVALAKLASLEGHELGISDWLVIDQGRIDRFAEATGDDQWVHVDAERCAALGGTIAHGYLLLSLIPKLRREILMITGVERSVNYGLNKVRFLAPVKVGGAIRLRQSLLRCEQRGIAVRATHRFVIEARVGEGVQLVAVAEMILLEYPLRPARATPDS